MTRIGAGMYQGSSSGSAQATQARLVLIHLQHLVAKGLRADGVQRSLILRPDDGNDSAQYDENQPPESEARRFYNRFIAPERARPDAVQYDACLGACENWHRDPDGPQPRLQWRAAFELALCRIVQNEWGVSYGWGSIPIGNLEPSDLGLFAGVLQEAAFTSAHLYLGPGRRTIAEETDPWYVWRPTRLWLPECRKRGLRFPPVLATEVGTYYHPAQTGLTMPQYAQTCVDIVRALESEYIALGVTFLGGIPFGYGTVGTMDVWRMDGTEGIIAAANPEYVAMPSVTPQPPVEDHMGPAELERYIADVWKRYGVPRNPNSALYKYWYASLVGGRFLGYPMESEHPSETGRYVIQGFSSALLSWDSRTGQVEEQLPLA